MKPDWAGAKYIKESVRKEIGEIIRKLFNEKWVNQAGRRGKINGLSREPANRKSRLNLKK